MKQYILNELNLGEDHERECKLATGGLPESIWETYSSFANTNGGTILLGIREHRDSFTVEGLTDKQIVKYASHVLVVEGEDDKIALNKILSSLSPTIKDALIKNKLVIQPLAGATNLNYELSRLRSYVCRYFVFLDADEAGYDAAEKAIEKGLLSESDVKYSICNGNNTAEFEDCLKKDFYIEAIRNKFSVDLGVTSFRNSKKWSDRVKTVFLSQGQRWTDAVEKKVKMEVTKLIPVEDADSVLDEHKRGSIDALVNALENMLSQR